MAYLNNYCKRISSGSIMSMQIASDLWDNSVITYLLP